MHEILQRVQLFLTQVGQGKVKVDDKLIDEFGELCKKAVKRQFERADNDREFKLYMSSIGKPICQLKMEKLMSQNKTTGLPNGIELRQEAKAYSDVMKFIYGDLVEALALLVLKASGTEVKSEQKRVEYKTKIEGTEYALTGKIDCKIDNKPWDIKSCSDFAFNFKFRDFETLHKNDDFAYIEQLGSYAIAENEEAGGFIAINRETGEWRIVEVPANFDYQQVKTTINFVLSNINKPFKREFIPVEEVFNRKKTGNTILDRECAYCKFKYSCWPEVQMLPSIFSTAKTPKLEYYINISEDSKKIIIDKKQKKDMAIFLDENSVG